MSPLRRLARELPAARRQAVASARIVQDGEPEALAAVAGPLAQMLAAGALLG